MPTIFFTTDDGHTYKTNIPVGVTLMQGARDNGVHEILGECGGNLRCGTCQCYVNEEWLSKTGAPSPDEQDMLSVTSYPKDTSRLTCQIIITEELDGLTVDLPKSQY